MRRPTAVMYKAAGAWIEESIRTVTNPGAWTPREVVTVSGRRFKIADPAIVLIY